MSATATRRAIELAIELPLPPSEVWPCFSDATEYARWYPPEAFIEPGVGGVIESAWPGGLATAEPIVGWEPERLLATQWEDPLDPSRLLEVTWTLEPTTKGTRVRLVHEGFADGPAGDGLYDGCERGWRFQLQCLEHYLVRHRGEDRAVAMVGRPTLLGRREAWGAVTKALGAPKIIGSSKRAALAWGGGEVSGRVLHADPPADLVVVDDASDGLFRLQVDLPIAPGTPHVVYLVASRWGTGRAELEGLEKQWEAALEQALTR